MSGTMSGTTCGSVAVAILRDQVREAAINETPTTGDRQGPGNCAIYPLGLAWNHATVAGMASSSFVAESPNVDS
jgi:hypothetical protein